MRFLDFSSWQGVLMSVLGLGLIALVGVGVRVLMMLTLQQRQQRMNRQINERLKTLIAAYKTLGGSFTGQLTVSPTHLRELRDTTADDTSDAPISDRPRRIRDAVEAALADILLLGTDEQVRLAAQAASDMAGGRAIHTAELVISLRNFVRLALDLDAIAADVAIPLQGPTRPQAGSARGGKGGGERERSGSGGGTGGSSGSGMALAGGSGETPAAGADTPP